MRTVGEGLARVGECWYGWMGACRFVTAWLDRRVAVLLGIAGRGLAGPVVRAKVGEGAAVTVRMSKASPGWAGWVRRTWRGSAGSVLQGMPRQGDAGVAGQGLASRGAAVTVCHGKPWSCVVSPSWNRWVCDVRDGAAGEGMDSKVGPVRAGKVEDWQATVSLGEAGEGTERPVTAWFGWNGESM